MEKLSHLYEFALENDIAINDYHFSDTKKAASMDVMSSKNIILDLPAISSRAEEGVLLAEEIGHFETGALYIIKSNYNTALARSNRLKYEAKAKHWAYERYLSAEEIQRGINANGYDDWLVAEYCEVTMEFLHNAILYYQTKGIIFDNPFVDLN